jgi:two-component system phosphate regulon response regulator OmpR
MIHFSLFMTNNLLVVDDDRRLRDLLAKFLQENGFQVQTASCAAEARTHLAARTFDLIILDIMMPGETGLDLTKSLRQSLSIPILLLSARGEVDDKVEGLTIGAEDYLTKPFEPKELLARIRVILRRSSSLTTVQNDKIKLGAYEFDREQGTLTQGGNAIFLTSTELILLKVLAQNPRQPFSREDLSQKIGYRVSDRTIDVQITRLRRKLGDDPRQPRYIQTVRHIGYVLCPDE